MFWKEEKGRRRGAYDKDTGVLDKDGWLSVVREKENYERCTHCSDVW